MFEASYGISLRSYRHKLLMEKARAALTAGTLIKQLAYDLGYAHVANFTRAYRRAFGESPSKTLRRRADAKH
jgi:AraC-like DNA-binding protein